MNSRFGPKTGTSTPLGVRFRGFPDRHYFILDSPGFGIRGPLLFPPATVASNPETLLMLVRESPETDDVGVEASVFRSESAGALRCPKSDLIFAISGKPCSVATSNPRN